MAVWPIYPFLCKTASWMWNHFNIVIWTLVPAFSGNLGSNNIEFTVFDIDLTLYNVTRSKRSFFFGARTINPNGEVRFSTEWWMNFNSTIPYHTMTIPKELTTKRTLERSFRPVTCFDDGPFFSLKISLQDMWLTTSCWTRPTSCLGVTTLDPCVGCDEKWSEFR